MLAILNISRILAEYVCPKWLKIYKFMVDFFPYMFYNYELQPNW